MIYSMPSFLQGHVTGNLACPRVMAAPENIKAAFTREKDAFAEQGITYLAPLVTLGDKPPVAKHLHAALSAIVADLTMPETQAAVVAGYAALEAFNARARRKPREILGGARASRSLAFSCSRAPTTLIPGSATRSRALMERMFGAEIRAGAICSPFDIHDVCPTSYSANTNEILCGAKFAACMSWIGCVICFTSYDCGMDQPTYTPVQQAVERSGTLYFSLQDLGSTKPAGSVKIRVETIAY